MATRPTNVGMDRVPACGPPTGPQARHDPRVADDTEPRHPLAELFRDLRSSPTGLSGRDAARRLTVYGPNELRRRTGRRWPRELLAQFTQPLVILLAIAAALAWAGGTPPCRWRWWRSYCSPPGSPSHRKCRLRRRWRH
jgi:Cation transporter/ATPase, N-terminus